MTTVLLDPARLEDSLAEAQAALAAAPPGAEQTWLLPAGRHPVPGATTLGAAGRSLTVAADPAAGAPTVLEIDGADVGLALEGVDVALVGIEVEVTGDELVAVRLAATQRGSVTGCRVTASGRSVVGLQVDAGALAELVDVTAPGLRATTGDALAMSAGAPVVRVHRATVDDLSARGTATGLLAATPAGEVTLSRVVITRVAGAQAVGAEVRAGAPVRGPEAPGPGTDGATVLDLVVQDVQARADAATARGLQAAASGALDVRGVTVSEVDGARAIGAELETDASMTVSGATVRNLHGAGDGAVGVLVRAGASPEPLVVDDVQVEAVAAPDHADLVRGLDVQAAVGELAPWLDADTDAGAVYLTGCVLRRVSGTAVRVDGDLRDVELRGVETYEAATAARLRGERVLVTETTWHRLQHGLELGPCTITLLDSLVTEVAEGGALVPGPECEILEVSATFGMPADPAPLVAALPDGLPYAEPGPPGVPASLAAGRLVPEVAVDLGLADPALHELAVRRPADPPERLPHLGAQPPRRTGGCDLRDPLVLAETAAAPPPAPGPVVDRTTKDGRGLLAVMQARAAVALPGWTPGDAADLTTTLFELVAHRLDRISYRQDAALTEAYLPTARLRRSVEEHARLVDYRPDPGLSATTMLSVDVREPALLGLETPAGDELLPFLVGAGTVAVNPDAAEDPVVVSTEQDLEWRPSLVDVRLAEDVPAGAVHAVLAGDLLDLDRDRWLVLAPDDPRAEPHVVRATLVEVGTDTTLVWWDPRRPAPERYEAETTRVLANVVPAHHGLSVGPDWSPAIVDGDLEDQVAAASAGMDLVLEARSDTPTELPVPLAAASRVAPGWPFPGEPARHGAAEVSVVVDGEPWRAVDDVATVAGEVFALAAGADGSTTVVLGQPGALPDRPIRVRVNARLGRGVAGNVGAHTLTSLVALGPGSGPLPDDADLELLREALAVDNPVRGVEGRDPEPLDRIRRLAPWAARHPVTAVTAADHARLLEELPEVGGARARMVDLGERRLVRATLLLRDEDTLTTRDAPAGDPGRLDRLRDAERLRRWSLARRRLDEVRLLGMDVELVPPSFVPVDLNVVVDALPTALAEDLHREVVDALEGDGGLFDPDTAGLGGDIQVDAVLQRVLAVEGVAAATVRRLRRAEAGATEHAADGTLPVGDEEVAVLRLPYGDGPAGLLTVEVCGGVR